MLPTLKQGIRLLTAVLVMAGGAPRASSMSVVVNYDYDTAGFFSNAAARASLEATAAFFSAVISDQVSAIVPTGINRWRQVFTHPSTGALHQISSSTSLLDPGASEYKLGLSAPADQVVIYAGGQPLAGSTLGFGGPGGYSTFGTGAWNTLVRTRGESGVDAIPPTDFAPWGGAVAFDNDGSTTWHFDHTSTPVPGSSDFYSVALHEVGHVLGLSGSVDAWETYQTGDRFAGPQVISVFGQTVPTVSGTDHHWAAGTMSTIFGTSLLQEAAMSAVILTGSRKVFTELDVAALRDVGWEVVPEPNSGAQIAIGLAVLVTIRSRRWAARR